jgi:hypothetical protein
MMVSSVGGQTYSAPSVMRRQNAEIVVAGIAKTLDQFN